MTFSITRFIDITLKLVLWFLITTDISVANCLIGIAVAIALPSFSGATANHSSAHIKTWLKMIGKILLAIPKAYIEAFEMILNPHKVEAITIEKVRSRPTRGLIFLDIFLITFTPKTIVIDYFADDDALGPEASGSYVVHSISRR